MDKMEELTEMQMEGAMFLWVHFLCLKIFLFSANLPTGLSLLQQIHLNIKSRKEYGVGNLVIFWTNHEVFNAL